MSAICCQAGRTAHPGPCPWHDEPTDRWDTDPSSPETRQGPSPVPEPSDGGNASERDSQGVESASFDEARCADCEPLSGLRCELPAGHAAHRNVKQGYAGYVWGPDLDGMAAAIREQTARASAAECEAHNVGNRAASWWEAAKHYAGVTIKYRKMLKDEHARAEAAEAMLDKVRAFCAERAEYVTTLRQCTEADADYYRWQGGAEARRQLSERLGWPVAWPAEMTETVRVSVEEAQGE